MSSSRNAPCPCGSGRKYKHCHGAGAARPERSQSFDKGPSLEHAQNLHERGYLPEAEMLYREILERSPGNADAMNLLGILRAQCGDQGSALEWLGKAVEADSQNAVYSFNLGKILMQFKRAREACEALERATSLEARYTDAYNELGLARGEAGSFEAAEAAFRKVLSLEPGYWAAHNNLGLLLHRLGRGEEAGASLRRAIDIEPRSPTTWGNLGMVLRAQGRAAESVEAYRTALALTPRDPAILTNLGNALADLSQREEAAACFRDAVAAAPDHANAHYNWGLLCLRSQQFLTACEKFRSALAIDPQLGEAENGLASALLELGRIDEAIEAGRRAVLLRPQDSHAHSHVLFALLHSAEVGPRQLIDEHREWARRHAAGFSSDSAGHANSREPERRLRIGYVSGDFRRHSVAQFFEPVLARHDRGGFEIFCYYNLTRSDETTERLRRRADCWREIASLGDDQVADLVRSDRIDILVDLSGHTKSNRLLVFAREPAPVQVSWLGYPATTGLEGIRYRISDAIADPPGMESPGPEMFLRLADGFLCYQSVAEAPRVSASPASVAGHVTFGSFNSLAKLNSEVINLWQRILDAVPESRLLIKAQPVADPGTRAACVERLVAQGLAQERLDLEPGTPTLAEHLATYSRVDIALDPFPYNGTTTSCEALWMGVPVVTLAGDRHAGRVGASLLTRIGLEDMIAHTRDEYLSAAVALARDPARIAALRAGMRDRVAGSPLMGAGTFTRNLEQAYRSAWRNWCENPDTVNRT
jgi:protein O-GlcNAc transferase